MTYKPWTPKIVGGTDMGDNVIELERPKKEPPKASRHSGRFPIGTPANGNFDINTIRKYDDVDPDIAVCLTTQELAEYSEMAKGSEFIYGTIDKYRSGNSMRQGQYVMEYRNDVLYQTFWTDC